MYNTLAERYTKFFVSFGPPTLFFKMKIKYNDGSEEIVKSDGSWKYSKSPITYNSIFGGEDYNANLEQKDWNRKGFKDREWKKSNHSGSAKRSFKTTDCTASYDSETI